MSSNETLFVISIKLRSLLAGSLDRSIPLCFSGGARALFRRIIPSESPGAIIVRLAILPNDSLTESSPPDRVTHPDHYQSPANKDLPPRRRVRPRSSRGRRVSYGARIANSFRVYECVARTHARTYAIAREPCTGVPRIDRRTKIRTDRP